MKLTQRSNGIWQLDLRAEGKGRISTGTRDRAEALSEARRILGGRVSDAQSVEYTLSDALDDTWEDVWKHAKSKEDQTYVVEVVRRKLGHHPAAAITYGLVNEWVQEMRKEGLAASTVNSRLSAISRALRHAADLGRVETVPRMPRLPVRNKKVRYLTHAEEDLLHDTAGACFDDMEADTMRKLMLVLVHTGCRLSEIVKSSPEDVERHTLILSDTKNTRPRAIPLTEEAEAALASLHSSPMWQGVVARGQRKAKDWCVRRFTTIRNRAGLKDVTLHILRHTTASRLVQAGVDRYKVQTILGHSSPQVTERYAHLDVDHLRDDMSAVRKPAPEGDNVIPLRRKA